jgi:CBS domain-containing protein
MKVREVMTPNVEVINPDASVLEAAKRMAQRDTGVLPVCDGDRLVGMLTDRDIVVRVVAAEKDPVATKVREAMTAEVEYCFDDEDTEEVALRMAEKKLRRLVVLDRDKRLVGIVSVGDLARAREDEAAVALSGAAQPGGPHEQTAHAGDKPAVAREGG